MSNGIRRGIGEGRRLGFFRERRDRESLEAAGNGIMGLGFRFNGFKRRGGL